MNAILTTGSRVYPDAYHLLLMQCLIRIKAGIGHDQLNISYTDCKHMKEITGLGESVLRKIFGVRFDTDRGKYISLNVKDNSSFYYEIFKARGDNHFQEKIKPIYGGTKLTKNSLIPHTYPTSVPDPLRSQIAELVEVRLRKGDLCDLEDLEGMDIKAIAQAKPDLDVPSEKLSKYLNTAWYIYLYFPHRSGRARVLRSVLKIGDHPNRVETIAPKGRGILNDHDCKVHFDRGEEVLIFNGVTKDNGERALHMKVVVGNRRDPPSIMLGEYSNKEPTAARVHTMRIVLQYAGKLEKGVTYEPESYAFDDPRLDGVPPPIRDYVKKQSSNFRITPNDAVFNLEELASYNEAKRRDRYRYNDALGQKARKIMVSIPRYGISNEEFESYRKPLAQFVDFLETETPYYELLDDDYFLRGQAKPESLYPRDVDYYLQRVDRSDVVIVFFPYADASECIVELTAAIQAPRTVYLIAFDNEHLPMMYRRGLPKNVYPDTLPSNITLETLGQFLIAQAPYSEGSNFFSRKT